MLAHISGLPVEEAVVEAAPAVSLAVLFVQARRRPDRRRRRRRGGGS